MKILLLGEYSNLHWTLAEGLRALGNQVCVVSDGDRWRNYQCDLSLKRKRDTIQDGLLYMAKVLQILPQLRGYDVVQIINPCFLHLKAPKCLYIYKYLRKYNKKIFLGAFGNDYYWANLCMNTNKLRYSEFRIGNEIRETHNNKQILQECLYGGTAHTTQEIASSCNGIIACLWEYYAAYVDHYSDKLTYIPLPIDVSTITGRIRNEPQAINFFIGIQSARSDIKGTDVMYPVLQEIERKYPTLCHIIKAVDVPFSKYQQMMDDADVQLDQLYSYTPSMNSLLAMGKGIVVVGGGEEENYQIINEQELRPIINVRPSKADIYHQLEQLVLHKERIPELSSQSIEYVKRHHDHIKVAQQYIDFWETH